MIKIRIVLLIAMALCITVLAHPKSEDKGPNLSGSWPTTLTIVVLQDEGLVAKGQIDATDVQTVRLSSEKVGKDFWYQLYLVKVKLRTGQTVQAIAGVNASPIPDMRMGPVVYVVSKILNPEGKPSPEQ